MLGQVMNLNSPIFCFNFVYISLPYFISELDFWTLFEMTVVPHFRIGFHFTSFILLQGPRGANLITTGGFKVY